MLGKSPTASRNHIQYGFIQYIHIHFQKFLHFHTFWTAHHFVPIQFCNLVLYTIIIIWIISNVICIIISPIILFIEYIDQLESANDVVNTYEIWLFSMYFVLLIGAIGFSIEEYRLIRLWHKYQEFDILKSNGIEKIELFHNHIHEQKIIYAMLKFFFGSLSMLILEYVGIMEDGSLQILELNEDRARRHKHTMYLSLPLFERDQY